MWLTAFNYGTRYTRKLAATIPTTIKIVIIIPFLVVLFFFSGISLFCDKTSNKNLYVYKYNMTF